MPSQPTLDFDKLLAPISEANPAGAELKEDAALSAVYYKVKDARDLARQAERDSVLYQMHSDEEREKIKQPAAPNWELVVELSEDVLARHSKDLWICAWLVEGLCREHQYAGLRDGFKLARELVERFWEGIHPRPDEDGIVTTVAQFAGLNGEGGEGALIAPIDAILITQGKSVGPYSSLDYKQATALQKSSVTGPSLKMIETAADETEAEFSKILLEDVEQAIDEFGRLTELFDQKCGSSSPPSSQIQTALVDCRDRIALLYKVADEAQAGAGDVSTALSASSGAPSTGRVATREEAFRLLLQVADFFRRTEPHSPVSYALEQAVRWGRMPLPELLMELVSDSSVREEMFRRTGIPKPESES